MKKKIKNKFEYYYYSWKTFAEFLNFFLLFYLLNIYYTVKIYFNKKNWKIFVFKEFWTMQQ